LLHIDATQDDVEPGRSFARVGPLDEPLRHRVLAVAHDRGDRIPDDVQHRRDVTGLVVVMCRDSPVDIRRGERDLSMQGRHPVMPVG
jgi:hypothetical protein